MSDSREPKQDVTYNDEVKFLFQDKSVTTQITSYCNDRKLTPPKSYSYRDISDDNTCILIYNALKAKRFDKVNDLMNASNLFAAWIKEGRMETLDSDKKPEPTIKPDTGNSLTYRDIYSLFTNCDHFNMIELNIPLHAAINPRLDANKATAYFETFKSKSDANAQTPLGRSILGQLKLRNMPKEGQPWTDNEINMLSAWIYDGQRRGTPIDLTNTDIAFNSHMKPSFPPNVTINQSDEPVDPQPSKLNFNDHIIIMFALGHRNAMFFFKQFDLHQYSDVNREKVKIFYRLTRTEPDHELMPQYNPWPRKNILLFYTWATQGPNSRESSEGADPQPYPNNDSDYLSLKQYYTEYLSYIESGERKV